MYCDHSDFQDWLSGEIDSVKFDTEMPVDVRAAILTTLQRVWDKASEDYILHIT